MTRLPGSFRDPAGHVYLSDDVVYRLIEAPKTRLREAQSKILREILDRVPPHPAAHGFVAGRSIVTNADPHVGKRFLVKFDLENFYPSVRYSRVVAIFRAIESARPAGDRLFNDPYASTFLTSGAKAVVALTRSGTTTEVLRLLGTLRNGTGPRTVAITADPDTPVVELADHRVVLGFADEKSIVQTRFATPSLALLRARPG